ncbi:MAG: hypothetical protein LBR53_10500 [Deltaproteobacteria bacterium]|nr:hypothetical protein [Deltaproteobacteria bacterium]
MDVNDKLRKEFEMLITDRKRMVVEQIREEGLLQGWEEGWEEGWKEGRKEGGLKARQAIAMKMLAMGLPLDSIVKAVFSRPPRDKKITPSFRSRRVS